MIRPGIRPLFLLFLLALVHGAACAQSGGLYWFGSIANRGGGLLTTDGRISYLGNGYNGPYDYFVTMNADATVEHFTTHALSDRSGDPAGTLLTRDGYLLRAYNTRRPGTNIPELVLAFIDPQHTVLWTRTYAIDGYRGSQTTALGRVRGEEFLLQMTFLDSNHTASARIQALVLVDRAGNVLQARTSGDEPLSGRLDTLAGGDLLLSSGGRITRMTDQWEPVWSKDYTSTEPLHSRSVDVNDQDLVRMAWNMGDTTFQFEGGGQATWPTHVGLISIDPANGAIQATRKLDQAKPIKVHGITALEDGSFMLFGSYNTLRPYTPNYMRVYGLLQHITPAGDILSVDTFHYAPQLRSSEIQSYSVYDGHAVMSINLHDGTNPSRYFAVTPEDELLPCYMFPGSAVSAGTVVATATERPLWTMADVEVHVTDLASANTPSSVNIARVCGPVVTDVEEGPYPGTPWAPWPNPATDRLHVSGEPTDVLTVRDLHGRILHTTRGTAVEVGGLVPGLYVVEQRGTHGLRVARFQKH